MKAQTKDLLNALESERIERNMSQRAFSTTLLKVTESYWCMIRKGKRRFTLDVLQSILQTFPTLGPYVDAYIRDGDEEANL